MLKISIITPTHDPKYLEEAYRSLASQAYPDWEWIILPNANAVVSDFGDHRVRVIHDFQSLSNMPIGLLKSKASSFATGDLILEFDHDDILVNDALSKIAEAFMDQDVDFAFTNFAEFRNDEKRTPIRYDKSFGWLYRTCSIDGYTYHEALAPPAEPPYITNITHAPNHARVWRTAFYRQIGGHNPELVVADDYDLVVRTYLHARKIAHIKSLLYLYRVTGDNTFLKKNQMIQENVRKIYHDNVYRIMLRWCADRKILPLDLGAAHGKPENFLGCDVNPAPGMDFVFDLEGTWPFDDNSVGVIRCHDVLEHVSTEKKIHFFNEAWRVLAPGGALLIEVPSFHGNGAIMDPTHKSYWCVQSFWYHTMENYQKFVRPMAVHSFMQRELFEYFPSPWHKEQNIPYVRAHLFAVKPDGHPHPLPIPSMYPPANWKPRLRGSVSVHSPATELPAIEAPAVVPSPTTQAVAPAPVIEAPAVAPPTEIFKSIPASTTLAVLPPIDRTELFTIDETLLDRDQPFEKVLMKVDTSTPFSKQTSATRIVQIFNDAQSGKLLPFQTKWHVLESVSLKKGPEKEVVALIGHFVPAGARP